ncbi:MAG: hypothetical protein KC422_17625 [Trueperaceae bacterium]|nr:hypothetical protein [Trueperaceae bacterium]
MRMIVTYLGSSKSRGNQISVCEAALGITRDDTTITRDDTAILFVMKI